MCLPVGFSLYEIKAFKEKLKAFIGVIITGLLLPFPPAR